MSSLERIARALDTSQLDLLAGAAERSAAGAPSVVRVSPTDPAAATLIRSAQGTRGPYAEGEGRLLVDGRAKFQPMEFCGANVQFGDYYRHAEDEFITVVDGDLEVDLEAAGLNTLSRGDSLYFVGGTPHRWRSVCGEPYRLLIVKQRFVEGTDGTPGRVTLWSRAATAATFDPAPEFGVPEVGVSEFGVPEVGASQFGVPETRQPEMRPV